MASLGEGGVVTKVRYFEFGGRDVAAGQDGSNASAPGDTIAAMSVMSDWMSAVAEDLGLDAAAVSDGTMQLVLDVTAEVAHGVTRPAAPVTAFLIGLAAGREADPLAAADRCGAKVVALARTWSDSTPREQA